MICKKCNIDKPKEDFRERHLSCKKCNSKNSKIWGKRYRENNKEKIKAKRGSVSYKQTEAYRRNKKKQRTKAQIKDIETLHRRYIYKLLYNKGFSAEDITPELIETQRLIIKTKRLCKTLEN